MNKEDPIEGARQNRMICPMNFKTIDRFKQKGCCYVCHLCPLRIRYPHVEDWMDGGEESKKVYNELTKLFNKLNKVEE